ncbi:MAG: hypothetical protein LC109_02980 [Bacteroidia bacterium]|nr:hypothetical protein [Bacteroidia bacterium]
MNIDSTRVENTTSAPQFSEKSIIIGCNYHVKWQKHSAMRFVLKEIKGDKARLITRNTGRDFWTNISDLIFIMSKHNIEKAKRLSV